MLQSEFIERTGFYPTYDEYKALEEMYNRYDGNKDEFCATFCKKKQSMLVQAREIACRRMQQERDKMTREQSALRIELQKANERIEHEDNVHNAIVAQLKAHIEEFSSKISSMKAEHEELVKKYDDNQDRLYSENCELRKQVEAFKQVIQIMK